MKTNPRNPEVPQSEEAFLAGYDSSRFPRPSVAIDLVLMTVEDGELRVLLLQRQEHPARGKWAMPGGFVGIDESVDGAARRVLKEKVRLSGIFVEQLYTFGEPDRDPRTRVISVAYFALVTAHTLRAALKSQAKEQLTLATIHTPWAGERGGAVEVRDGTGTGLQLAFDHAEILGVAVKRLRGRLKYSPIAYQLLPDEFTLRMLQTVHEAILSRELNKDAFRRRVLGLGEVKATGRLESDVDHRPAELYRHCPVTNE
ncbi:MAG: NUDIX domain-containing protein [Phycisphaerales bacterium]|nr:NUDIX domain-containing protein [Phycisphaerales bacterium]